MRPFLFAAIFLSLTVLFSSPLLGQEEGGSQESTPTAESPFDVYTMVFLKKGENNDPGEPEELGRIQRAHRDHLTKLRKEGKVLVAGPFEATEGSDLQGIVIYHGDLSLEEVRALAEADPAVQAGRLRVEALRWWTPGGAVSFNTDH